LKHLSSRIERVRQIPTTDGVIRRLAWSPSGGQLAVADDDGYVRVWNRMTNASPQGRLTRHGFISSLSWSPNEAILAAACADIYLLDPGTLNIIKKLEYHTSSVWSLSWSPDGSLLASGAEDKTICIWNASRGVSQRIFHGHSEAVYSLAWAPTGFTLCSGSENGELRAWTPTAEHSVRAIDAHAGPIASIAWLPDATRVLSASADRTIGVWNVSTSRQIAILEGHTEALVDISLNRDGSLLVSVSADGKTLLWDTATWKRIGSLGVHRALYDSEKDNPCSIAQVDPTGTLLAAADSRTRVCLYSFELSDEPEEPGAETTFYRNARVVLLGESGVGKSGLGLALTGDKWIPTESTHARKVKTFSTFDLTVNDVKETREVLLWDLAGQPDYRIIHQLHLADVATALVVFDSSESRDPLAGVRHWVRALHQAKASGSAGPGSSCRILVAAREDVGRINLSPEALSEVATQYGFSEIHRTSAKEGWGIEGLRRAITSSIGWDDLPRGSSNSVFQTIKDFLMSERSSGRVLSTADDLYRAYLAENRTAADRTHARAEFLTCVGLLETRDIIHRLGFGNLILLQPELIDAYTSAIVNAARDEPKRSGGILEEIVKNGLFRMPEDARLADREQERLLLHATIEELLTYEIALRDGQYLLFPSQISAENPDLLQNTDIDCVFRFEGPLLNIYASLAVRLSHSEEFSRESFWKNGAVFSTKGGGQCGLAVRELDAGVGEFTVFSDSLAPEEKVNFRTFIHAHLLRRSIPESVEMRPMIRCPNVLCRATITEEQRKKRLELGHKDIKCNVCEASVSLAGLSDQIESGQVMNLNKLDAEADSGRDGQVSLSRAQSKAAAESYDALLIYEHSMADSAAEMSRKFFASGVLSLAIAVDPRRLEWRRTLEGTLLRIPTAVVLVGRSGSPPWNNAHVDSALQFLVARDRPVIPVAIGSAKRDRMAGKYQDLPPLPGYFGRRAWIDLRGKPGGKLNSLIRELGRPRETPGVAVDAKGIKLMESLRSLLGGPDEATNYRRLTAAILSYVFAGQLSAPEEERTMAGGLRRADILFENKARDGFFNELSSKHNVHCPYIFVECKNYLESSLSNPDFDQLLGRLDQTRGMFGMLTFRRTGDRKGVHKHCRELLERKHVYVMALDDDDLAILLRFKSERDESNVNDYMADLLRQLVL
jgi:WD40 repeat protein